MKTIIVTAIGSFSASCVIGSLKRDGWKVIGTDIYLARWHYESTLCDHFERAPLAIDREPYISFLLDVAAKYKADALLPLTDIEIDCIDSRRDVFAEKGIQLFIQPHSVLKTARDKYNLYLRYKASPMFTVPESFATGYGITVDSISIPCIAKPRDGRSSEGLVRIKNMKTLEEVIERNNYIIQEMIDGPIFTVDYVRDLDGNDFAIPRKELIRTTNGAGMTVQIEPKPELCRIASSIGADLGIIGAVNMEFIESDGKYCLIDINPRFSAGIGFTHLAGYDIVTSAIRTYLGESILPGVPLKVEIMQKKLVDIVTG